MKRQHRSATSAQQSIHRGRRIACRPCRQAKIRCDLSSGGTTPCARCRRLEQDCEIDSDFKRVNKRARLEELEDEVRLLRSSVSTLPPSISRSAHDRSSISQSWNRGVSSLPTTVTSQPVQSIQFSGSPTSLNQDPNSSKVPRSPATARSLGHLELSSTQIDTLFQLFFRNYHLFVPLLDPSVAPDDYFRLCPLLFWVIIFIASRQYADEPSLLTALAGPVKGLMWEAIANPPHTWYIVQALSLSCMWPFPTSSLSTDTTPVLVNIAQTIAMQLGLHQPEAIQDFSRTKRRLSAAETSEVVRTWSVCYIASQSVFTTEGMTLASSEWIIDRVCDEGSTYMVPSFLKQQLLIYRFSARLSNYMSKNVPRESAWPRAHDSLSALALLEQEFTDLSRSIGPSLPAENDILLSSIGLQLYVFYLLDSSRSLARKMALARAFDMATDLISKLQQLDTASNFMKHCPSSYFRATSLAALFILRLEDSNFAGILDGEKGKQAFNAALSLLRRASLEDSDLPGRTFKILAQLWTMQGRSQHSGEEPRLKLRTRLGASLLHDTMWRWRENFGGQISASHTPPLEPPDDPPSAALLDEHTAPTPSDAVDDQNRLFFEEVFDAEMLSLLPFDLDDVPLEQPEVAPGVPSL